MDQDFPLRFQFGYRGSIESSSGAQDSTVWLGPVTSSKHITRWVPPRTTSIVVVAVDAHGGRSEPVIEDVELRQSDVLLDDVASHAQDLVLAGKWEEATSKIAAVLVGLNDQATAELGVAYIGDSAAFRDDAAKIMRDLVQNGELFLNSENIQWIFDVLDAIAPDNDGISIQKGARSAVANIMKTVVDLWLAPSGLHAPAAGEESSSSSSSYAAGVTSQLASHVVDIFSRLLAGYRFDSATEEVRNIFVAVLDVLPGIMCRSATLGEDPVSVSHPLGSIRAVVTDMFGDELDAAVSLGKQSSIMLGPQLEAQFASWGCDSSSNPDCRGLCLGVSVFPEDLTAAHFDEPSSRLATVIQRAGVFNPVTGLLETGVDLGEDAELLPRQWLPLLSSQANANANENEPDESSAVARRHRKQEQEEEQGTLDEQEQEQDAQVQDGSQDQAQVQVQELEEVLELPEYECRYFDADRRIWEKEGCTFFVLSGDHVECRCATPNVYVAGFEFFASELSASIVEAPAGQYFKLVQVTFAPGYYEVNDAWQTEFLFELSKVIAAALEISSDRVAEAEIVSILDKTGVESPGATLETGTGSIVVQFKLLSESVESNAGAGQAAEYLTSKVNSGLLTFEHEGAAYLASSVLDVTPEESKATNASAIAVGLGLGVLLVAVLLLWWLHRSSKANRIGLEDLAVFPEKDGKFEIQSSALPDSRLSLTDGNTLDAFMAPGALEADPTRSSFVKPSSMNSLQNRKGVLPDSPDRARKAGSLTPLPPLPHPGGAGAGAGTGAGGGTGGGMLPGVPGSSPIQHYDSFAAKVSEKRPSTPGLGSEPVMPAISGSSAAAGAPAKGPATPQMTWDYTGDVGGTPARLPAGTPAQPAAGAAQQRSSVSSIAGDGAGAGGDDRTAAAPGSEAGADGAAAARGAPSDVIEPPARTCICGKPADLGCTRCRGAFYCSAECQRKDWKNHKVECKKAAARRRSMGAMRAMQAVQAEVPAFVPSQHRRESSETAAGGQAQAPAPAPAPAQGQGQAARSPAPTISVNSRNAGATPAAAAGGMRPRPMPGGQMMSPGRRVPQPQFGGGGGGIPPQGSPGQARQPFGGGKMQRPPGGGPAAGFNPRGAPGLPGQNRGPGGMMPSPLRGPGAGPRGPGMPIGAPRGFPGMNPPQVVQGSPRPPNRAPQQAALVPAPPAALPPQAPAPADGETEA